MQQYGQSALHKAAHWNSVDVAELLLGANAAVNAKRDVSAAAVELVLEFVSGVWLRMAGPLCTTLLPTTRSRLLSYFC